MTTVNIEARGFFAAHAPLVPFGWDPILPPKPKEPEELIISSEEGAHYTAWFDETHNQWKKGRPTNFKAYEDLHDAHVKAMEEHYAVLDEWEAMSKAAQDPFSPIRHALWSLAYADAMLHLQKFPTK